MNRLRQFLCLFLSSIIVLTALPERLAAAADDPTAATPLISAKPSQQELQQLVAPIALYPDSLVAQVLAASTYPDEIVEADRWLQAHPELKGDQLAQAVDQQPWDPSVKALAEFPSVLANMDKNLSWTSSLGDAYINNQQGVMNAVQQMRQAAQKAGNLKSTSQLKVVEQAQSVIIEPVNPEVVYVPEFDPWLVYGYPIVAWPGWYWYPGLYWTSPVITFGFGYPVSFFSGFGWGWHAWAPDWRHNVILVNHVTYVSHSRTVINRNYYINRTRINNIHSAVPHGAYAFQGGHPAPAPEHGLTAPHVPATRGHVGVFGGFDHGGVVHSYSSRGFSSMRGSHGGGFHGGHR